MTDILTESARTEFAGSTIIVDTSALLAASQSDFFKKFEGATVLIPVVVIKELEGLRGSPTVGYFARRWLNTIEQLRLSREPSLTEGVKHRGVVVQLVMNNTSQDRLPARLRDGSADSVILSVAANLAADEEHPTPILVSNDLPMRLHALMSLDVPAVHFTSGQSEDSKTWTGDVTLRLDEKNIQELTDLLGGSYLGDNEVEFIRELVAEETDATHALVRVETETGDSVAELLMTPYTMEYARRGRAKGELAPRSLEQRVANEYLFTSADELPFVSLNGAAGTGKTLLAAAAGIESVLNHEYRKVAIFRSLHEMGRGQEMGFLPGDVNDKMGPWRGAIQDAFEALCDATGRYTTLDLSTIVEVSPITYLRGRSLANSYVILEEAQNFSKSEILNVMSRLGEGSKMVLTFDDSQVDNRYLQSMASADVWSVVNRLASEDLFAHVTLKKTERSRAAELASRVLVEG